MLLRSRGRPHCPLLQSSVVVWRAARANALAVGPSYPLLRHLHGSVNFKSYIRGCSYHHTYNRAVTIHGVHNARFEDNVAYKVMGHTVRSHQCLRL